MLRNHCDICGVETFINPRTEPVFEEREVEVVINEKTKETMKKVQKFPVTTTMQRQDHRTGEIREVQVQKVRDLDERSYLIQLTVGSEYVHRDFCKKCLDQHVRPFFGPLWDVLAKTVSKE